MKTAIAQPPVPERWLGPLSEIVGNMPVSYFGIVLGLAGLGNAWRGAEQAWRLPKFVADWIYLVAGLVCAALVVLFVLKALLAPDKLAAEAAHPVQCCFIGLAGVATMLIAGGLVPHERTSASVLFGIGFAYTLCFAVWRTGVLWQGERDPETTTAVLYLPTVAGSFVSASVASSLGYSDWGQLAFGAGMFSWLALESVLLHRAFSFGLTAMAAAPAYLLARGDGGMVSVLIAPLFVIANIFFACLVLMTLSLLITGKMFVSLRRTEHQERRVADKRGS
jgi:tellurite resistance protein TehA-like permease